MWQLTLNRSHTLDVLPFLFIVIKLKIFHALTHLCRVESSILTLWKGLFPIKGVYGLFLSLSCFVEISEFNTNSVEPDQTPRSGFTLFANVLFMGR